MGLQLHKMYSIDEIEKLLEEHELMEKRDGVLVSFDPDGDVTGEIGEITMPLYFVDGTIACNFILVGYSASAFWRCIYICILLSEKKMEEC